MVSPSICGGFLTDKSSMVAFTWTISTLLTLVAFLVAIVLITEIHTHYRRMERYYSGDDWYQGYIDDWNEQREGGGEGHEQQGGASHDYSEWIEEQKGMYIKLATLSARSMTFVAAYTMVLAIGLSLYGSTAIVGFTSLRGVYIQPCFSSGSNNFRVGIFGGAIVLFANLLVVCAVILGEVRVEDFNDQKNEEENNDREPYQVERIATILAVTCMFLSALYTIFAVLLFLCHAGDDIYPDGVESETGAPHSKPLVSVSHANDHSHSRQLDSPGFITMDNSSQGTA